MAASREWVLEDGWLRIEQARARTLRVGDRTRNIA
jgi:hypothetical protein